MLPASASCTWCSGSCPAGVRSSHEHERCPVVDQFLPKSERSIHIPLELWTTLLGLQIRHIKIHTTIGSRRVSCTRGLGLTAQRSWSLRAGSGGKAWAADSPVCVKIWLGTSLPICAFRTCFWSWFLDCVGSTRRCHIGHNRPRSTVPASSSLFAPKPARELSTRWVQSSNMTCTISLDMQRSSDEAPPGTFTKSRWQQVNVPPLHTSTSAWAGSLRLELSPGLGRQSAHVVGAKRARIGPTIPSMPTWANGGAVPSQ